MFDWIKLRRYSYDVRKNKTVINYWRANEEKFCVSSNDKLPDDEDNLDLFELRRVLRKYLKGKKITRSLPGGHRPPSWWSYSYGNFELCYRNSVEETECKIFYIDHLENKCLIASQKIEEEIVVNSSKKVEYPNVLPYVLFLQDYVAMTDNEIEIILKRQHETKENRLLDEIESRESC